MPFKNFTPPKSKKKKTTMADGGSPATKKLKAADGSSANAPVVAEDESTDLAPPSIPFVQSAGDLHAVLAQSREDASCTTTTSG